MKQFKETYNKSNLDRYVGENYHEVDFDFVKPIIEERWKGYMNLFGWSIDEVLDAYQKTKSDISGLVQFDYVPSKEDNKFVTKPMCAKIVIEHKGKKNEYITCDQRIVASSYFGTFSKNALTYLVVKRFPFLSELRKEERKKMYVCNYLQDKRVSEIPEEYRDRTLKDLYSCYDKIEVTEVVDEFSIYFNDHGERLYFFMKYPKLSFIINFEDLINKDFNGIVEKDHSMQEVFIKMLTNEETEERLNSRGMRMIREYCESK